MSTLVKNKIKKARELKITCRGEGWQTKNSACNCVINVGVYDIRMKKINIKNVSEDNIIKYGFICSSCGCFTSIPKDKLPADFIYNAKPL